MKNLKHVGWVLAIALALFGGKPSWAADREVKSGGAVSAYRACQLQNMDFSTLFECIHDLVFNQKNSLKRVQALGWALEDLNGEIAYLSYDCAVNPDQCSEDGFKRDQLEKLFGRVDDLQRDLVKMHFGSN